MLLAMAREVAPAKEVFTLNIHHSGDSPEETHDEAQEILDVLGQIQASPELRAEASTNPDSVLNRFNLSAITRQAVAFSLTGLLIAPVLAKPENFW
jgi:hypothetical protein